MGAKETAEIEEVETTTGSDDEIRPITVVKLLLFLVWWFSGIGVGTAFMSPSIIGDLISTEVFLVIILSFFCSFLLMIVLAPGREDTFPKEASTYRTEK